jgi:proline dehydrogenase
LPIKPAIRLVKGAYPEPAGEAFHVKSEIDANYLALCTLMLPEVKREGVRLVLGTHDIELVDRAWRFGAALELKPGDLEVAMLYGIRTEEQLRLAREGFVTKVLIAYGDAWYAWYVRRLAERPLNLVFALRQILG